MMDSFFNKGFKAAQCKTLLKLAIPRIKHLRNRREIQMKQMHREIAKFLETGQEATALIWVEHIIRNEKMMAAQEILELFCELISIRLLIIEAQWECPLDLKEAISSICFAAPRCANVTELVQV
ncbi:PREDICTED: IST1 homolog [Ipomoea nil]|uniref:IST1 homolog n=1 Tax=Ipomoea nil TaxID=35883 RepID=UPI000900A651|nr:PREDICTED: IST1 homolog [Ipomoea nil]